ncbi:MAG: carboxymuconolactone decarboxylase family protein [Flavobacteriales bacterium TMED235]|nr:MAG: carboxymuconolactone decarboxylase family protein [Flavobacteriales bacterium TMED235]
MDIAHIETKQREDFPEFKDLFDLVESFMGYLPNAYLLMADKPDLLQAFAKMSASVFSADVLDIPSKQLIALASSLSAGCKYCQSHTSHGAERAGVPNEKIAEILNYRTSEYYEAKEVALLDLAFASGEVPNKATKAHFEKLKEFYSKEQILEAVAVISFFGFLNRWNDTFGTEIEEIPADYLSDKLKPKNW